LGSLTCLCALCVMFAIVVCDVYCCWEMLLRCSVQTTFAQINFRSAVSQCLGDRYADRVALQDEHYIEVEIVCDCVVFDLLLVHTVCVYCWYNAVLCLSYLPVSPLDLSLRISHMIFTPLHQIRHGLRNTRKKKDGKMEASAMTGISRFGDLNLTERLAELERLTGSIAGEVSQRQGLLDAELIKIENLVDSIGDGAPSEDAFNGPAGTPKLSDVRLNLMKRYVSELEATKVKRIEEVKNLSSDCHKHMVDLMCAEEGFKTMADSEDYLALDRAIDKFHRTGDFTLGLYKSDIARLTQRLRSFVEEKERRRIELGQIGSDIARLWTLLRIPSAERDLFSSSFKMNLSMETLSKGVDELARLREIRSQSLGKVITSIREDIAVLWTEAGIESEEVRMAEFPLYFQDVSEMEDSAVSACGVLYLCWFMVLCSICSCFPCGQCPPAMR